MTDADQALGRLAEQTAEAVLDVLAMLAEGGVEPGPVTVLPDAAAPFAEVAMPCVATDVSYVDGVAGGNVLLVPVGGARLLAAAMMSADPPADEEPLSELELSAVGEAMNQMMSAAAGATSAFLEQEVEIAPPRTRVVESADELADLALGSTHVAQAEFTVVGVSCRLVQLVPNAFVVRMGRALSEISAPRDAGEPLRHSLRDIPVRVWAELGRRRMPMAELVALPPGDVLELDREAEAPIDLYVDGMHFGGGRLVVTDDGDLAVRIEAVAGVPTNEPEGA